MNGAVATSGGPASVLELDGISVQFGGVHALQKVSMALPDLPGISAIIGPNGAGKTTLFNVVSGLVKPQSGRVIFRGADVTGLRADQVFAAGLSRTFQGVRLFANLTLIQNLLISARSMPGSGGKREALNRSTAALDQVGLHRDLWDRYPSELSLAQSRFAEVARAIASRPAVLMLDEPGAGLNPAEKIAVSELFREIARNYRCRIVLVEHDMKLVMAVAETIWVMNFGTILTHGSPEMVQNDPAVIEAYLGSADDDH